MSTRFKFLKWYGKKAIALLVLTCILGLALAGATVAFVIVSTDKLNNEFTPAELSIASSNDGYGVINDGEVSVYVRAAVVCTWESTSQSETVLSKNPKLDIDYSFSCADGWIKAADGFWYYTRPIAPDAGVTVEMISSLVDKGTAPEGYKLSFEVLFDAIQSSPANAVLENWASGVSAVSDSGTLSLVTN